MKPKQTFNELDGSQRIWILGVKNNILKEVERIFFIRRAHGHHLVDLSHLNVAVTPSVAYPDPYKKNGWIRNPDPYQMIRNRIQLKPLKTENNFKFFTLI